MYDKIPHNANLFKWKLVKSPYCEYCQTKSKKQTDGARHFIFECTAVVNFWENVTIAINIILKTNIQLLWRHIIYGYKLYYKKFNDVNFIISTAAFAVYKAKMMKEKCMDRFLKEELLVVNYVRKSNIIGDFVKLL